MLLSKTWFVPSFIALITVCFTFRIVTMSLSSQISCPYTLCFISVWPSGPHKVSLQTVCAVWIGNIHTPKQGQAHSPIVKLGSAAEAV